MGIRGRQRTSLFIFGIFLVLGINNHVFSQNPGLIYDPATGAGAAVLDPNGDGLVSFPANTYFQINDQTESELPFQKIVFPGQEPAGDLSKGATGGFTDLVDSGEEDPAQYYFDAANLIFRLRLGAPSSASKGYSILIDTDQLFGPPGSPNPDPDYTSDNPGFEIEISLQTNFGVYVYDINNTSCPGAATVSYAGHTNYQKSFALSTITGSTNSFFDFYVPLTGLSTWSVSKSTKMRMVIVTTQNPGPVICNNGAADIAGIDDQACGSLSTCLTDIVDNYTPTSIDDVETGVTPLDRSTCRQVVPRNS